MLVSVVIPVRDGERFLVQALESVLSQTHKDLECIVVDDGSVDATPDIATSYGEPVCYLRQDAGGVSRARNAGIARARGEAVAFLDADDLWLPNRLELQLIALENDPDVGMVYSGLHVVDEELRFIGRMEPPPEAQAFERTLLMERPTVSIATALVRSEALQTVDGFDERLSTSADSDLACRIIAAYPVVAIPEPLMLYRQHHGGMHLDPLATQRDRLLMFDKFFRASNARIGDRLLARRAYANLYASIAARYFFRGEKGKAFRFAARALGYRPDRVAAGVLRLARPGGLQGRWGA